MRSSTNFDNLNLDDLKDKDEPENSSHSNHIWADYSKRSKPNISLSLNLNVIKGVKEELNDENKNINKGSELINTQNIESIKSNLNRDNQYKYEKVNSDTNNSQSGKNFSGGFSDDEFNMKPTNIENIN